MNLLSNFHTFHTKAYCQKLHYFSSKQELFRLWQQTQGAKIILGSGSNVLFVEDFLGAVFINQCRGMSIIEHDHSFEVIAQSGENWHNFITSLLRQGIYGLENLALIYGTVGAAPIQNIGAYGVEMSDFCTSVGVIDLISGEVFSLSNHECQFGYRESIFKHQLKDHFFIYEVRFSFPKSWQPRTNYAPLNRLDPNTTTAHDIFTTVIATRTAKLPNPNHLGNAGSFFKNPLISLEHFHKLQSCYPHIAHYRFDDKVKIAAAWLIDNAGLKGVSFGGAQVHQHQPLVLINANNATGSDIVALANIIYRKVFATFAIELIPEVRFIGSCGEIDALQMIKMTDD